MSDNENKVRHESDRSESNSSVHATSRHVRLASFNPKVINVFRKIALHRSRANKIQFTHTQLTDREREVLELICLQYTTIEIGEKLFISHRTVEGHRTNLLQKTGMKNVVGLVVYALKNELVTIPDSSFC